MQNVPLYTPTPWMDMFCPNSVQDPNETSRVAWVFVAGTGAVGDADATPVRPSPPIAAAVAAMPAARPSLFLMFILLTFLRVSYYYYYYYYYCREVPAASRLAFGLAASTMSGTVRITGKTGVAILHVTAAAPSPCGARELPSVLAACPAGEKLLTPPLNPVEVVLLTRRRHLPSPVCGSYDAALTGPGGASVRWIGKFFLGSTSPRIAAHESPSRSRACGLRHLAEASA